MLSRTPGIIWENIFIKKRIVKLTRAGSTSGSVFSGVLKKLFQEIVP